MQELGGSSAGQLAQAGQWKYPYHGHHAQFMNVDRGQKLFHEFSKFLEFSELCGPVCSTKSASSTIAAQGLAAQSVIGL